CTPAVTAIIQIFMVLGAGLCFLNTSRSWQQSVPDQTPLPEPSLNLSTKDPVRRPLTYLAVILVAYGMVFGFLHVIPLGLPSFQLPRVLPNLIGAAVAVALFAFMMFDHKPTPALVWNRIMRVSFPFVTLAALLVPYTSADEYVSSLAFVESAQFFFLALLICGCFGVCRDTGVDDKRLTAYALLTYNIGFVLGDFIAMLVHDLVPMEPWYFGLMGIGIFLLLTSVTLNSNAERHAKTAWGIIPKETPQAMRKKRLTQRCDELADAGGLTTRERETLHLLGQGMRPKEISQVQGVSITTVRTHVQGVYVKLNVHSADDLKAILDEAD
ncbi:MAG: helix-turn-helix transcriptional regulator, partial [Eggerthellales bacterium]|nr:helix-turn-helix transcriptional regulator [Eggerthellales bacterium]